ncbi:hypothetical protein ABLN72_04305 [Mycobacterium tuberculosis]
MLVPRIWCLTYKHPNTSTVFHIYRETLSRFFVRRSRLIRLRKPSTTATEWPRESEPACG